MSSWQLWIQATQSEDGVETCIWFEDKCAAMQATALAFHPAFPPLIPPSFCGMPALEVHSGSWIPTRITAVQGCSKSFPWSVFCWFTQCRVSVHPVKADLLQSVQRTGNANSSTCLSALPWQLGDQHSTLDHSAGPHACYWGTANLDWLTGYSLWSRVISVNISCLGT